MSDEWRCRCGAANAVAWANCENCGQTRPTWRADLKAVPSKPAETKVWAEPPYDLVRSVAEHVAGLFEAPRPARRDRHRAWLERMGWDDEVWAWDQWLAKREARK
jgi:hypothetical protein